MEDTYMKFCTHCGAEIADDAVICVKCGCSAGKSISNKQLPINGKNSDESFPDGLLVIYAGIIFLTFVIQFLITKIVPDWYGSPARYVYQSLSFIRDLSLFLPAISIKKPIIKIVGIILIAIPIIDWIVSLIKYWKI
jgi:hypothetical protein